MLDQREALRPPAKDQVRIDTINANERAGFETFIKEFDAAIEDGDGAAVLAAFDHADAVLATTQDDVRDHGFTACLEPEDDRQGPARKVTPSDEAPPDSPTVIVDDLTFRPRTLEITAGQTVVWRFSDSTAHDVRIGDMQSPKITEGQWAHHFDVVGQLRLPLHHPSIHDGHDHGALTA